MPRKAKEPERTPPPPPPPRPGDIPPHILEILVALTEKVARLEGMMDILLRDRSSLP